MVCSYREGAGSNLTCQIWTAPLQCVIITSHVILSQIHVGAQTKLSYLVYNGGREGLHLKSFFFFFFFPPGNSAGSESKSQGVVTPLNPPRIHTSYYVTVPCLGCGGITAAPIATHHTLNFFFLIFFILTNFIGMSHGDILLGSICHRMVQDDGLPCAAALGKQVVEKAFCLVLWWEFARRAAQHSPTAPGVNVP